ncbi:hypothetical protein FOLKNPGA_03688 (plasmid) [Legionella sp. PC1000]|nr:hypothetical protein [Legionella sp. PC1000]QLZ70869.1 hypothetical protein FOLKNPGA_03688 [Legionella sp. PC1000]
MNMLKKISFNGFNKQSKDLMQSNDNPYLNARRTWNGHVAGVMSALQVWQVVGITSLMISLASVGGYDLHRQPIKIHSFSVSTRFFGQYRFNHPC